MACTIVRHLLLRQVRTAIICRRHRRPHVAGADNRIATGCRFRE